MTRVDPKQIEALLAANRDSLQATRKRLRPADAKAKAKAAAAAPPRDKDETARRDLDRRLREDRSAHREDRRPQGGRRLGQAAATARSTSAISASGKSSRAFDPPTIRHRSSAGFIVVVEEQRERRARERREQLEAMKAAAPRVPAPSS